MTAVTLDCTAKEIFEWKKTAHDHGLTLTDLLRKAASQLEGAGDCEACGWAVRLENMRRVVLRMDDSRRD